MPRYALTIAACLAALTTGCGGAPDEYNPVIEEDEKRLGAEQHPLLLAEFGGAYQGSEAAYAENLGEKLAEFAGLGGQCTFTLVNSDVVNAFAVPGCYIYVTRGLMGLVNSEAELASVLSHELGHIVADHSERQQKRSLWRGLGVLAVGLITGSEQLTRIAGGAAQLFTLRYSRTQEYESDDLGIRYLREAGYDPYAAADMLDVLARQERYLADTQERGSAEGIPEWARTHPLTENRIERARDQAAATGAAPDELPEHEGRFLAEVDGLLYGDDPEQGFVIGRTFAHPEMRIAFDAPAGFTLANSPQAVLIDGPDGLRGEFGGGRLPPEGLEAYAASLIEELLANARAEIGQVQRVRINGIPAVIVPAHVQTPEGAVELSIAAYAVGGGSAYHFMMVSPPSGGAAPAIGHLFRSFRLLTAEQAASLQPRRIDVVTVGPGDDVRSLARRMTSDHPLEHFLMLNGLQGGATLRPGEQVKIVVGGR